VLRFWCLGSQVEPENLSTGTYAPEHPWTRAP